MRWRWSEDLSGLHGYHPTGVPEPQEILKPKTTSLDKLSVLSKHHPHLRARQGPQRPLPTLEEPPSRTRTHTQPGPVTALLAGRTRPAPLG